jgi:hypothetical protein
MEQTAVEWLIETDVLPKNTNIDNIVSTSQTARTKSKNKTFT